MVHRSTDESWPVFKKPSARTVIVKDGKVLLVYSKKYDYYKFPGGGIESGESATDALIREVAEETGYQIIPETIEEYGRVLRKNADSDGKEQIFEQENFYYCCETKEEQTNRNLDAYEKEEEFTICWLEPMVASSHNRNRDDIGGDPYLIKRDEKVLDLVDLEMRKRIHAKKKKLFMEALGKTEYADMMHFVEEQLHDTDTIHIGNKSEIRYNRSEHIYHVLNWAKNYMISQKPHKMGKK